MNAVQKAFYSGEDYESCYIFAPSISKRKTVDRQTYYVRRYFHGGKDFEKTMKTIAVQRTTNNVRSYATIADRKSNSEGLYRKRYIKKDRQGFTLPVFAMYD